MKVLVRKPLIDVAEIAEIELLILRRMREHTMGEHASVFRGSGFDFVGLRDWEPGDRPSNIDWPQSTFNNFTPLVVREFEQHSTATIMVVADRSASTFCSVNGVSIASGVARAIATIGLSAVFFQDMFGVMTFDRGFDSISAVRPRIGRNHVIYCMDAYQHATADVEVRRHGDLSLTIGGHLRNPCLIPIVSDFLDDDVEHTLRELAMLNTRHDVFLVLVDSAFAFDLPDAPAGWVEAYDVETHQAGIVSAAEVRQLGARVTAWQDEVARLAKDHDLDVLRLGAQPDQNVHALLEFVVERRLRRV
ncbi:MAG: hypothetical protein A3F70_06765 [Acidobacteria bacterium RIFCSPLOWO2_12_FULL_67_14]|nr:MAG: hypothetical protein A3H29_18260 [Acidobacteria bacterium RIFCSPLOWO2_02_FULL_67_21]OFW36897.1 MAG: hypothetical protein A3F70_06765 [Acidobacteria bacterium RIFCSPLOWO2_12_FULL_67_14]